MDKINGILLTSQTDNARRVYSPEIMAELLKRYSMTEQVFSKKDLEKDPKIAQSAEYIFTTWGMEHFSQEEIGVYFPNAKYIFYAAGSVQSFAREFLDSGIRVFSSWQANAVPVAEYTYAQILLAAKGFFQCARLTKSQYYQMAAYSELCGGNYGAAVGIIGVGSIGRAVAEKLRANDVKVYYYDPFLPTETAKSLNIHPATLEEIFTICDVITNHLPDKMETAGILSGELFAKMKPYAAFINTGRGRQVDEEGLAAAMNAVPTRTALLDVLTCEPLDPNNPLAKCDNVIITPHIAGSNGREVVRMAEYMLAEAERLDNGEPPLYEVSREMLKTMA